MVQAHARANRWLELSGWRLAALAVAALAAAILLRGALDPWLGDRFPVTTLFGAIALVALLGGLWAGVATAVAGYLVINFLFLEPRGALGFAERAQLVGVGVYGFTAACLIALAGVARYYARRTQEEKELLAVTLTGIGDGVITCDAQARITMLNPVAEALTGWSAADARGAPMDKVFRILNEHTRAPAVNPVMRAIREGRITGLANHTILVTKDGREIPIDDSAAPIVQDEVVVGAVLVFRDITERKRAFDTLAEADRRKTEFLAIVGHELRNPIAALTSAAYVIHQQPGDAKTAAECAGLILRQGRQLARLVDDLLDVSRIESGTIRLHIEPVPLEQVIREAAETSAVAIQAGGHTLRTKLPPRPPTIRADGQRVSQVLANLLTNAARYSPQPGEIKLDCDVVDGVVKLAVTDHGMGIRPEDMSKLFHLFGRLDTSASHRAGLGIGLALSRSLVELHGGSIEVKSEGDGKGSCFTVTLPASGPSPGASAPRSGSGSRDKG